MQCLDDADRHFRLAAALNERIGAPSLLARTRLEWARMLLPEAKPGTRSGPGDSWLATARELGLGTVERRVMALLDCP